MTDLYDKVGEEEVDKDSGPTPENNTGDDLSSGPVAQNKKIYTSKPKKSAAKAQEEEERTLEKHQEDIQDRRQDRRLRKKFASIAFWFAVSSAAFFALIIIWSGFSSYFCETKPFNDDVIVCVAGATTVNLFAAFLVITRGLFCVPKD